MMFKKISKKHSSFKVNNEEEEKVEIKATQHRKKINKCLVPIVSQSSGQDIVSILNAPDLPEENLDHNTQSAFIDSLSENSLGVPDEKLYTIDKKPMNVPFNILDSDQFSQSESIQNEEVSVDHDDENFGFQVKKGLTVSDLIVFLQEKEKLIQDTKERYQARLADIKAKQSEINDEISLELINAVKYNKG